MIKAVGEKANDYEKRGGEEERGVRSLMIAVGVKR